MIIGHQKQWQFLENSYKLDRIAHAYLFHGPEMIGKRTFAVEFIKFLNCKNKSIKPCEICRSCQDIEKNIYQDFFLVKTEQEIKIAQIRELEHYAGLTACVSAFKAVVVDQAHLMNQEAQNCLLKILEEPKSRSIFILITEHPDSLLPTILSRVQKIKFFLTQNSEIKDYLKKQNIPDNKINEIIHFCYGKPGLAKKFLSEPQLLENIKQEIKEFIGLFDSDMYKRFQYAKKISEYSPYQIKQVLDIWAGHIRETIIEKSQISSDYSLDKLKKILFRIQDIQSLLFKTNVNSKIAIETLMLEL